MSRKFKFRGYDNPSQEHELHYGDGVFTVGKIYSTERVDNCLDGVADGYFIDDEDEAYHEELVYFDEVEE